MGYSLKMNNNEQHDLVIVGAGLTGLHLARSLEAMDHRSLILEKSKGLGGRAATRRISDLGFDHGAPFLENSSVLSEYAPFLHDERGSYHPGGMNQLAKAMAGDLEILRNQKLKVITPGTNSWSLETEEGLELHCRNLIITAPLPQALELLAANSLLLPAHAKLEKIHYSKALIYLAVLKEIPAGFTLPKSERERLFLMRDRNLHPQGIVLHLSPALSESLFVESDETILRKMREEFHGTSLGNIEVLIDEPKKWKFSRPLTTLPESYTQLAPGLFLTGDAFNGALYSANNLVHVLRSLA